MQEKKERFVEQCEVEQMLIGVMNSYDECNNNEYWRRMYWLEDDLLEV